MRNCSIDVDQNDIRILVFDHVREARVRRQFNDVYPGPPQFRREPLPENEVLVHDEAQGIGRPRSNFIGIVCRVGFEHDRGWAPVSPKRIADRVESVHRSQRHGGLTSVTCSWLAGHAFFRDTSCEIVESRVYASQASGIAHNDAEPMRLAHRGGGFVGRRLRPSQIACRRCRHRYQCECRDRDPDRWRMSAAAFEGHAPRARALHGSRTARRGHAPVRHPISGQNEDRAHIGEAHNFCCMPIMKFLF